MQVESSEPGVRIEANNDYVGKTPLTLKIFSDKDGTFHNFGTTSTSVRAFPGANQYIQTKVFRTWRLVTQKDMVPKRICSEPEASGSLHFHPTAKLVIHRNTSNTNMKPTPPIIALSLFLLGTLFIIRLFAAESRTFLDMNTRPSAGQGKKTRATWRSGRGLGRGSKT